jgi:flavin-dependent dehydrogenase
MTFDVAVVGAGTAGAGVAWQCARRGMKVCCVDAHPLEQAGARWVNGVALWQLDDAGVPRPGDDDERCGGDGPFHLVAGWGETRVVIEGHEVVDLDMRRLVTRLQGLAEDAGVELRGGVHVHAVDDGQLDTDQGPVRAEHIVDASGLGGARLTNTPPVEHQHICTAAQAVHRVADGATARAYFRGHEVPEGQVLCFTGVAGGYSIVNVRLEGDEVSILTGSIPADGHPSGRALLDRFVAEHPWVGEEIFGGARAIPIRRPFDRLVFDRVAVLGDAASQVFSAHGSGIGLGLIAGRTLAEALEDGEGLEGYERRFLRERGGLLAAYDIFRRYSQTFDADDIAALMRAGLLDGPMSAAGMAQRWPTLDPQAAAAKVAAIGRAPAKALALGGVLSRMGTVASLYKAYPRSRGRRLRAWSRAVARVVGDSHPDVE